MGDWSVLMRLGQWVECHRADLMPYAADRPLSSAGIDLDRAERATCVDDVERRIGRATLRFYEGMYLLGRAPEALKLGAFTRFKQQRDTAAHQYAHRQWAIHTHPDVTQLEAAAMEQRQADVAAMTLGPTVAANPMRVELAVPREHVVPIGIAQLPAEELRDRIATMLSIQIHTIVDRVACAVRLWMAGGAMAQDANPFLRTPIWAALGGESAVDDAQHFCRAACEHVMQLVIASERMLFGARTLSSEDIGALCDEARVTLERAIMDVAGEYYRAPLLSGAHQINCDAGRARVASLYGGRDPTAHVPLLPVWAETLAELQIDPHDPILEQVIPWVNQCLLDAIERRVDGEGIAHLINVWGAFVAAWEADALLSSIHIIAFELNLCLTPHVGEVSASAWISLWMKIMQQHCDRTDAHEQFMATLMHANYFLRERMQNAPWISDVAARDVYAQCVDCAMGHIARIGDVARGMRGRVHTMLLDHALIDPDECATRMDEIDSAIHARRAQMQVWMHGLIELTGMLDVYYDDVVRTALRVRDGFDAGTARARLLLSSLRLAVWPAVQERCFSDALAHSLSDSSWSTRVFFPVNPYLNELATLYDQARQTGAAMTREEQLLTSGEVDPIRRAALTRMQLLSVYAAVDGRAYLETFRIVLRDGASWVLSPHQMALIASITELLELHALNHLFDAMDRTPQDRRFVLPEMFTVDLDVTQTALLTVVDRQLKEPVGQWVMGHIQELYDYRVALFADAERASLTEQRIATRTDTAGDAERRVTRACNAWRRGTYAIFKACIRAMPIAELEVLHGKMNVITDEDAVFHAAVREQLRIAKSVAS